MAEGFPQNQVNTISRMDCFYTMVTTDPTAMLENVETQHKNACMEDGTFSSPHMYMTGVVFHPQMRLYDMSY